MITVIAIENYQAIHRASLKLGKFTVVTGPTGSGKSAVVRAMKLAAFNARGTSYIRHGTKAAKVALGLEPAVVGITRGGRGADKYTVASFESRGGVLTEDYTKLAGGVPPEVSGLLQLSDLNFAGQHDLPFLLAESGSQVARTLGELTNVTLVLDAAREANRRKQEVARELRVWQKSLDSLREQAQQYRTLKARREAAAEAREHLDGLQYIEQQRDRAQELAFNYQAARDLLADADRRVSALAAPSADRLDSLQQRLTRLRSLYAQHREADQAARNWEQAASAAAREEELAHQTLHQALVDAGTCPTCGREMLPDE